MPAHLTTQRKEGFRYEEVTVEEMIKNYGDLDPKVLAMLENSFDRMPWRLYVHQEYPVRLLVMFFFAFRDDDRDCFYRLVLE